MRPEEKAKQLILNTEKNLTKPIGFSGIFQGKSP